MSISSEVRRAGPYSGNGSTTAFAFAFKVFNTSQVQVTRTVSGVETVLTLTTHYTVSLNANQNTNPGGTVTMLTAPAVGQSITITSNVANLQPTAIANLGGFYPEVINDSLDRATIQIQQLDERLDRALVIPVSSSGVSTQLPVPQSSALIGWDAGATVLQNYNSTPVGSTVYQYVHRVVATSGQTVFTLPVAYVLNAAAVTVFVNGLRLEQGAGLDWVETNTTTITFNSGLSSGDLVTFIVNILASVVPIAAFPAASVSAFGASLVDDADAATARATLGLVIGTNVQGIDATLTALAGLATGADKLAYSTGTDTFSQTDLTSFARTLLDDANAATARTTLGLGTADTPTFGGLTIADAGNVVLATGTGTKIGTATGQKLGFYNATPVIQQAGTGETVGFTAGGGTNVTDASTFTGNVGSTAYRISDIVKALKNLGLLAS